MKLIILPIVALFTATMCDANSNGTNVTAKLPNINYLGMSYDVVKGNPDNNFNDPGFLFSVVKFRWSNRTTSDGKYKIPDKVQGLQIKSCGYQTQVSTIFGSKSYQNTLSDDVRDESEGGPLWDSRFSGSTEYRKVSQGTRRYHRVYTNARAKCTEYEASLNVNQEQIDIELDDDFEQAFRGLPSSEDDSNMIAYDRFVTAYGTHFTSSVTFGSKMVIRSEFEHQAWNEMKKSGVKIPRATQLSIELLTSDGTSFETRSDKEERQMFESQRSSYSASYIGSHPPSDGKWVTWAQSTGISPTPIAYKLTPLTYFLTLPNFDGLNRNAFKKILKQLSAAYTRHCNKIPGCGVPGADPVLFNMINTTSSFRRSPSRLSCPPNYKLLSCGIKNNNIGNKSSLLCDPERYAIPASNTECECNDKHGAKCIAWCSAVEMNSTTAKSLEFHEITNTSCPAGYKVIACTIPDFYDTSI